MLGCHGSDVSRFLGNASPCRFPIGGRAVRRETHKNKGFCSVLQARLTVLPTWADPRGLTRSQLLDLQLSVYLSIHLSIAPLYHEAVVRSTDSSILLATEIQPSGIPVYQSTASQPLNKYRIIRFTDSRTSATTCRASTAADLSLFFKVQNFVEEICLGLVLLGLP